jgi:tetratricopeptide (TPR) repeat protein
MGKTKPTPEQTRSRRILLISLSLVLAIVFVYYPVADFKFVNYDDNLYVTGNAEVRAGLTLQSIGRAFTTTTAANWHPLTMLSLELDRDLPLGRGKNPTDVNPSGFHLTNVLLHAAASWLLFQVLLRMTGCLGRSVWVAALFAFHPLHVESVAWVAERKDVLSTLFWMITLLAYAKYAAEPSWERYFWVAVALTLGLMAKPMLVTIPFVMLLLDYWPLRRVQEGDPNPANFVLAFWRLVREKIPLFVLIGIFCAIALFAQYHGHALRTLDERPFLIRLETAAVAYVVYLGKMIWPVDLSPFYPFPRAGLPFWQVAGAICLLLLISALAWRERRRWPYLLVGWLWYLGTLVPVIGLVPVGDQAWADRYTYVPLIGIFVALAWGVPDLLAAWSYRRPVLLGLAVASVAVSVVLTRIQIGYWQDDERLWRHALRIDPDNDVALNNWGSALGPDRLDEAMQQFEKAVNINPKNDRAQVNLAKGLLLRRNAREAEQRLTLALQANSENEVAQLLLGNLCLGQGRLSEALEHLREAYRLKPNNAQTCFLLGQVFRANGQPEEAAQFFAEAVRWAPDNAETHHQLGSVLAQLGRWPEAIASLESAVNLQPRQPRYHCDLGLAFYERGQKDKALGQYRAASELLPNWPEQFNNLVWSLLTPEAPGEFQARTALDTAMEICQATNFRNPQFLDTLAAAYAANGRFPEAVQMAKEAVRLAEEAGQKALGEQIRERLKGYQLQQEGRQRSKS